MHAFARKTNIIQVQRQRGFGGKQYCANAGTGKIGTGFVFRLRQEYKPAPTDAEPAAVGAFSAPVWCSVDGHGGMHTALSTSIML